MDNVVATPVQDTSEKAYTHVEKDSLVTPSVQSEMPLEIYKQEVGDNLLQNILGVDNNTPEEFNESVSSVDGYINDLMSKEGYKLTTEAYKSVLKGIKKDIGISEDMTVETQVTRLSKYVESVKLLETLNTEDKESLIKKIRKLPNDQMIKIVMDEVEKKLIRV